MSHFYGRHLIGSYLECDSSALQDAAALRQAMQRGIEAAGATLLNFVEHVFPGNGITMVLLLAESHASIHTYPEHRSCFIDLFTCGDRCAVEEFNRILQEYLKPDRVEVEIHLRGRSAPEEIPILSKSAELPRIST